MFLRATLGVWYVLGVLNKWMLHQTFLITTFAEYDGSNLHLFILERGPWGPKENNNAPNVFDNDPWGIMDPNNINLKILTFERGPWGPWESIKYQMFLWTPVGVWYVLKPTT